MESTHTQLPFFGRPVNYYQELEYYIEASPCRFPDLFPVEFWMTTE